MIRAAYRVFDLHPGPHMAEVGASALVTPDAHGGALMIITLPHAPKIVRRRKEPSERPTATPLPPQPDPGEPGPPIPMPPQPPQPTPQPTPAPGPIDEAGAVPAA